MQITKQQPFTMAFLLPGEMVTFSVVCPMFASRRIWFLVLMQFLCNLLTAQSAADEHAAFASVRGLAPGVPVLTTSYRQEALYRSARATSRCNLFVFSREKKPTAATACFRFNTSIQKIFHRNIRTMRVGSLDELVERVDRLMAENPDMMLGQIWLDSHGRYKNGHALFSVGRDTIWAENIFSDSIAGRLERLTAYCDAQSKVTLGACYSGADFTRPGNDLMTESPMLGDSLVRAMASIFSLSPIYASKSWIMVKPFMFGQQWGISGFPKQSRFKDEIFRPAWEMTGQWNMVPAGSRTVVSAGTPYLSVSGDLVFLENDYQSVSRHQQRIQKRMKKLRPGVYRADRK
jgi:hypothetical protein